MKLGGLGGSLPGMLILMENYIKKSNSLPLLRCLKPFEANYAFWEVHEGIYENYLENITSIKLIWQGYYWPTIQDVTNLVKKCEQYQRHANIERRLETELNPMTSWLFAMWEIGILGPFLQASG